MTGGVLLQVHDAHAAGQLAGEIADLYRAAYGAAEPQASSPFYSRDRFLERLDRYRAGRGFTLITARDTSGALVGFFYGYVLPPGARWWAPLEPRPPAELIEETGYRTFAINDMVVRPDWRRRGLAREMHARARAVHSGKRFTLTVRPDNTPARTAYLAWGYRILGTQQPFPDSPVFETMILDT